MGGWGKTPRLPAITQNEWAIDTQRPTYYHEAQLLEGKMSSETPTTVPPRRAVNTQRLDWCHTARCRQRRSLRGAPWPLTAGATTMGQDVVDRWERKRS